MKDCRTCAEFFNPPCSGCGSISRLDVAKKSFREDLRLLVFSYVPIALFVGLLIIFWLGV